MTIYKLNVGEHAAIPKKYGIAGVPALVYFKDGKMLDLKMGVQSVEKLKELEVKNFN